jgi:hypothetical protein
MSFLTWCLWNWGQGSFTFIFTSYKDHYEIKRFFSLSCHRSYRVIYCTWFGGMKHLDQRTLPFMGAKLCLWYYGLRVFENRVLRRICGPKKNDVIWHYRKLRNEDLHNFYPSSNINIMVKSGRARLVEHVACMRISVMHRRFSWERQKKRDE